MDPSVATEIRRTGGMNQAAVAPGTTLDPFEVQVRDQRGEPMSGITLQVTTTGGTLDRTSATTDSEGEARATLTLPGSPGTVVVTFSGNGLDPVEFTAEARSLRSDAECSTDTPDTLSLSPGGVVLRDADGDDACFFLRAGSGERYRIGLLRSTTGEDRLDTTTVGLHVSAGDGGFADAVAAAPAPHRQAAAPRVPVSGALLDALRVDRATEALHVRIRQLEEEIVRRLPPEALLPDRRTGLRSQSDGTVSALVETFADAPDRVRLDVSTSCVAGQEDRRTAFLVDESPGIAFYQDSAQAGSDPVDPAHVQGMLDFYETYGEVVIEEYFGGLSDIDGNGQVNVVITPVVPVGAAAMVWSGDFFERGPNGPEEGECAGSNEMELVYFSAGTIDAMGDGNFQALGTLVHEVKHVSSLYQRIRRALEIATTDGLHPPYVEEGTAEIAAEVATRRAWEANGGPGRTEAVRAEDFEGGFTPWNFGIALRLARTVRYLDSQPNAVVVDPAGAGPGHSIYGSGWHFHRWLGDAYGGAATSPGGDAAFFREQNDSLTASGRRGIQQVTGENFLDLIEQWSVAVMLNGNGHTPSRPITTYDFPSAAETFCNPNPVGVYPWPVTTVGTTSDCESSDEETFELAAPFDEDTFEGRIGAAGGLRIHEFVADGSGPGAQFVVSANRPVRIVIVRIE